MSVHPGNQDLPILDELRADLGSAFRREERARARRPRRRHLRRLAIAAITLAVVLVPGSVVATRYIWGPDVGRLAPSRPLVEGGKPIRIAEGRGLGVNWRISAYMSVDGVCHMTTLFTATQSFGTGGGACRDELPAEWEITMGTHGALNETLIEGWVSPRVDHVVVHVPGRPARRAPIVSTPREIAERAGLPSDLRFYLTVVPGDPMESGRGFRVVAFDAAGREIDRREVPANPRR